MKYPIVKSEKLYFLNERSAWLSAFFGNIFTVPFVLVFRNKRYISPNAISMMSFIFFFASAIYYLIKPEYSMMCSVGFMISYLLDSADGKLARIRKESSQFGALLDAIIDLLCHSLGLIIVAIAMGNSINSIAPLIIILPYTYTLCHSHLKDIVKIISSKGKNKSISAKNKWQKFCFSKGLSSFIYNDWEVIYISILVISINIENPVLFLFISIYINLFFKIFNHFMKYRLVR